MGFEQVVFMYFYTYDVLYYVWDEIMKLFRLRKVSEPGQFFEYIYIYIYIYMKRYCGFFIPGCFYLLPKQKLPNVHHPPPS